MRAHGHIWASRYPLAYLFNETRFVQDRVNAMLKTDAVLMQAVITSAFGDGKHLKEVLEKLDG